jgi:hypothetical protein
MSLFDRFAKTKEEGFREEFIKPLLVKMGFVNISNKHGSLEFGKDYVFSEIDRFMHYRHMVVQAKHLKTINRGHKVDELLSQSRQAFNETYRLPSIHGDRRVSAVYVFNTGKITDSAQKQMRDALAPVMSVNVHFFDGHHLELMARSTFQRYEEAVRIRLLSLNMQLAINRSVLKRLDDQFAADPKNATEIEIRGFMFRGMEDYLAEPPIRDRRAIVLVMQLWQHYSIINAIVHKCYLVPMRERAVTYEVRQLREFCKKALAQTDELIKHFSNNVEKLPAVTI